MKLAIVGASGYLGRALVAHAAEQGAEVVATSFSQPARPGPATWARLDLRDAQATESYLSHAGADVVINCAYRQSGPDCWPVTATGAAAIARVARRLVHLSSDMIFPGRVAPAYAEDDPPAPVHDYGRAKHAAERAVLSLAPGALVVRTSLIYGGAEPGPQERLVERALGGEPVTFFTDEIRCPVQVDDLARAILRLVELESTGIYHVAGTDAVSRLEFARLLAGDRAAALRGGAQQGGDPRPTALVLDTAKAAAVLGAAQPRGVRSVLSTPPRRSASD